jgi:hypothetical protein
MRNLPHYAFAIRPKGRMRARSHVFTCGHRGTRPGLGTSEREPLSPRFMRRPLSPLYGSRQEDCGRNKRRLRQPASRCKRRPSQGSSRPDPSDRLFAVPPRTPSRRRTRQPELQRLDAACEHSSRTAGRVGTHESVSAGRAGNSAEKAPRRPRSGCDRRTARALSFAFDRDAASACPARGVAVHASDLVAR